MTKPKPKRGDRRKAPAAALQRAAAGLSQAALQDLVGYNLRRAEVRMRLDFARALVEWDIRPPEYSVLVLIASNEFVTQADLAEALSIKRPNMVSLIDRLEREGLIERVVYEHDRRNHVLSLTRKGEALVADIDRVVHEMDRRTTSCWSDKERKLVVELLRRFYEQP